MASLILYLGTLTLITVTCVISRFARQSLFKPDYNTWTVMVWLGFWIAADELLGIPLQGYSTLELFGIFTASAAVVLPLLLFGEHYTKRWWKVTQTKDRA